MKPMTFITSACVLALTLTGCNNSKNTDPVASEPVTTEQGAQTDMAQPEFIGIDDAIAVALKNTMGDIISIDFDTYQNGTKAEYKVEIIANDLQHEVKINAITSDVVNVKQESLDAEDQAEYQALQQAQVTLEQAMQVAADSIPNSVVTEASFDLEHGQAIYEINLVADNQKHEVKVDANTGSILSSKLD
ncbi:PepSY domain-containing protein [Psychrobacter lutiphocae]|uniref:PepSY domain-containing protein n=1 Tax=Psychrobacter lutiphocae TaxID=540500 RepID=UPI0003766007|nr:PepSY domain-containing protein [Psychrobacter lutiphocae]